MAGSGTEPAGAVLPGGGPGARRAERARGEGLQGAGAGRRVVSVRELSCGRRGWAELGRGKAWE